jgi:tRNA nucleotidyltransferase (CCA-adding enzyme)
MKAYRVGGAVRDRLLGRPVQDVDWVVVGATPEQMTALGYRPVGNDFPVFLHPVTGEEYALARTERKSGRGYKGFTIYSAPDVTLEDDLRRRDLTINAMAEDEHGALVDPFGGRADLERQVLRHVSPAFAEDPLRVLRVARFAARLAFAVAPETLQLMSVMATGGELADLVPERVWAETERALAEPYPARYFATLRRCGALQRVFPELDALFGVPQPERHHPEIDTGAHTLMVLEQAAALSPDPATRFAALMHDTGKALTPRSEWPRHGGHEERGVEIVGSFCDRWRVPNRFRELAVIVARHHLDCHRIGEMRADTILRKLESTDAFRRPGRFGEFLLACEADARGRTGYETRPYPQRELWLRVFEAARAADFSDLDLPSLDGAAAKAAIRRRRADMIRAALPGTMAK